MYLMNPEKKSFYAWYLGMSNNYNNFIFVYNFVTSYVMRLKYKFTAKDKNKVPWKIKETIYKDVFSPINTK